MRWYSLLFSIIFRSVIPNSSNHCNCRCIIIMYSYLCIMFYFCVRQNFVCHTKQVASVPSHHQPAKWSTPMEWELIPEYWVNICPCVHLFVRLLVRLSVHLSVRLSMRLSPGITNGSVKSKYCLEFFTTYKPIGALLGCDYVLTRMVLQIILFSKW